MWGAGGAPRGSGDWIRTGDTSGMNRMLWPTELRRQKAKRIILNHPRFVKTFSQIPGNFLCAGKGFRPSPVFLSAHNLPAGALWASLHSARGRPSRARGAFRASFLSRRPIHSRGCSWPPAYRRSTTRRACCPARSGISPAGSRWSSCGARPRTRFTMVQASARVMFAPGRNVPSP